MVQTETKSSSVGTRTYKNPKAKTKHRLIFCPLGKLKEYIVLCGSTNIARSVAMFKEALAYHIGWIEIQCPGILLSQNRAIGTQGNILQKRSHVP